MPFRQLHVLLLPLLLVPLLAGCAMPESEPAPPPDAAVTAEEPEPAAKSQVDADAATAGESGEDTAESGNDTGGDTAGDTVAILVPTQEPEAEAATEATEPADWTRTASVDGDYYVLGNPAAPIRLVDYSDFM